MIGSPPKLVEIGLSAANQIDRHNLRIDALAGADNLLFSCVAEYISRGTPGNRNAGLGKAEALLKQDTVLHPASTLTLIV
jgi:hypothetical protein